ncbi:RCC1-like domain-containing protein [Actinoplanes hulinensis]|uniref:RCC1-like domain-containing protein n=1 Tax=Actinoplanes hulinensis TaxID=1144547 RepID=UPI003556CE40
MWTWGHGLDGQLGLGDHRSTSTPTRVPGLSDPPRSGPALRRTRAPGRVPGHGSVGPSLPAEQCPAGQYGRRRRDIVGEDP